MRTTAFARRLAERPRRFWAGVIETRSVFLRAVIGVLWALALACDVSPLERVPPPDLPAPPGLRVVAASDSRLDWAWNTVEGAEGYRLSRDEAPEGAFGQAVYESPGLAASDASLRPSTTYYYRVQAIGVAGPIQDLRVTRQDQSASR